MAAQQLGYARAGKTGRQYPVKWDSQTKETYVNGRSVGRASSASEAMNRAEAYLRDK